MNDFGQILDLFKHRALWEVLGVWYVFMAAVDNMPPVTDKSSGLYRFVYGFLHTLSANVKRLTAAIRVPGATAAIVILCLIVPMKTWAQCGTERRDVKTLADGVKLNAGVKTVTVTALRKMAAPAKVPNDLARMNAEKQTYTVKAWALGYKLEADHDFHVVISEVGKKSLTMIAEIPSVACAPALKSTSPAAREFLTSIAKLGPVGKMRWFTKPVLVDITGVLFFDHPHGQTGVAPNAAELHPVLKIAAASQTLTAVAGR